MKKRETKRLENGEIQFSDKLNKKLNSVSIKSSLFELYDTEEKIKRAIDLAKEKIIMKLGNSLKFSEKTEILPYSPNMENVFIVPAIFGPLSEIEIKKTFERLNINSTNLKGLSSLKRNLTRQRNKLEKEFMYNCYNSIYRNEIFPEIELFLEDEYENLYKILEKRTRFHRTEKKISETKLSKQRDEYYGNLERGC